VKYWTTPFVVFAAGLAVAAFVGGDLAKPLIAQVRAALVRDVDHPARQAVTIRKHTLVNSFEAVYTVPANKKLVVEHVNCSTLGPNLYVGIFEGALTHANIVYSVPPMGPAFGVLVLDGQTRLYFEPGAVLNLRIFTGGDTTCTISGHTVDASL